MTSKADIWKGWTDQCVDTDDPISLFSTDDDLRVEYKHYGKDGRRILKRSERMEDLVREEGRKVINDWSTSDDTYGGLIYLMYWLDEGDVIPLYVGKAGKYGRDGDGLSANLRGLRGSSTGKFARWGDGHYYHIGNLSAIIFDHDKNQKQKYEKRADRLFGEGRQLRQQTYFCAKAWRKEDVDLYHEFEVPLEQLECQIIGLVADLYPERLLNDEGA